jgi:DNA (cytosine-5)-methyltransferase 1
MQVKSLKFVDLFCGIGGIRIGFENACRSRGLTARCVLSSEIQKDSVEVYSKNFGETPYGDVKKIDASAIEDFDVLLAGFPCQAFSISGKKLGFDDTRGTLFFDILRIVKQKKPFCILLENVKNLVGHDSGRTLATIISSLEIEGYVVKYKVLSSAKFGVPQVRERVYIVATLGGEYSFPNEDASLKCVDDILEGDVGEEFFLKRTDVKWVEKQDVRKAIKGKPLKVGIVNKGGQGDRIYATGSVGITLSAHGGGNGPGTGLYLVKGRVRRLTPRECSRMQGFPEWFKIDKNRRNAVRQFGNSVTVPVIERVSEKLLDLIEANHKK